MPGINTSGKPSTSDLFLGRGAVELAQIDSITGLPYNFRQIGNATAFSLNLETEKLEHQSSRSGVRSIDREIILQQKIGVTLTMDEALNFENLSLFLSGSATAGVVNPANQADLVDVETDGVIKGRSIEIRNASGDRYYDIVTGNLTVNTDDGIGGVGALLTPGTDYEIDAIWGTLFIPSGSAHVDGQKIFVSYTFDATPVDYDEVNMLTQTKISAFLRFKGINPANSDRKVLVDLHSVSLSADGDLSLVGEEFTELTLTGVAERNETGFPSRPVGKIIYHTNAV